MLKYVIIYPMNMLKTSLLLCMLISAANAESFLAAQSFPKTFQDVPFKEKIEILREGYTPFRIEYDENGVCISGCAYQGITIKDDMKAVDDATDEMATLIATEENSETVISGGNNPVQSVTPGGVFGGVHDWCHNGRSTKLPLRYPVNMSNLRYEITSDFGFRTSSPNGAAFHPAIDIACPVGTPVYATADGVVVTVDEQTSAGGAGKYINIKHDNGLITQYLHLNTILVSKGDRVSACQQIATSGNSGKPKNGGAYGAHLDYRIRFDSDKNKFVDLLCPCKTGYRGTGNTGNNSLNMSCANSLFYAQYKFRNNGTAKHSQWRVDNGHCMRNLNDLLPDETR